MVHQDSFSIQTRGRGTTDVTAWVAEIVGVSGISIGTCTVFLQHTSASLMLCENADPDVRRDLDAFMVRLVPDGDRLFVHTAEGPDDMPAHVRSVLTGNSLVIPVTAGHLALGTWQGLYLWEHRTAGNRRQILVTVIG